MSENVHRMKHEAAELGRQTNELLAKAAHALHEVADAVLEASRLDKQRAARFEAIETFETERFDSEWPTELRDLSDRLMRLSPDVVGTDQGHADLCRSIAGFLDTFFSEYVAESIGAPSAAELAKAEANKARELDDSERTLNLVSSALTKAESNRDQRIKIPSDGEA